MPLGQNAKMDRRRRVLMDVRGDVAVDAKGAPGSLRETETEPQVAGGRRGGAGYSQDVRRACGQRLVQLIPVRRRSYLACIVVSLFVPGLLLAGHYMIYVSGSLPWYGHPLAVALDASHHRSVAAWFSSHLWLLCLGATILTFQLRRHKLDDYEGEYRLWFWLVLTCLAASLDATTQLTELLGLALDRWSQLNLGWSGPAVVQATLAVLIGMLGLRLCSELKTVPSSLVFWLSGLILWAGSAALGQDIVRLDVSLQLRIWLKVSFWLAGLTCVWLAALTYLRSVYIEAQKRFLPRGRLAGSSTGSLRERLRRSMPKLPSIAGRKQLAPAADDADSPARQSGTAAAPAAASKKDTTKAKAASSDKLHVSTSAKDQSSRFSGWLRTPKHDDDPHEFKKVTKTTADSKAQAVAESDSKARSTTENDQSESKGEKRRLPQLSVPRLPKLPKPKLPRVSLGRMLPKIKLPSFRLPPPHKLDSTGKEQQRKPDRTSSAESSRQDGIDSPGDEQPPSSRPTSKAERRRMRRMQKRKQAA